METAAFRLSAGRILHVCSSLEKPAPADWPAIVRSHCQVLTIGRLSSSPRPARLVVSCAKTLETAVSSKSDVPLNDKSKGSIEKQALRTTFPSAFEALLLEVCDETSATKGTDLSKLVKWLRDLVLKKMLSVGVALMAIVVYATFHYPVPFNGSHLGDFGVGDFEMHLKRNVGAVNAPIPIAPAVPSEPMDQLVPATPSISAPNPAPGKTSPFASASSAISSKLAALEASGANGFKLVTSPTVGSFRRGRTVKGKKLPPNCKQGDLIKEGQVIGYIDQFGTQLPVKSDVAGEVLKLLFEEGEAVGYGDPLVAVLPSFHGLN